MKTVLFLTLILTIFATGYALLFLVLEHIARKRYKKDVDKKIKEAMFRELGFTYRETASGKKYVILDDYKGNKAIQV